MKRPPGPHPSTKRTSPTSRPWNQDSDRLSEEESEINDIHRKRLESMLAVDEMVGSLVEELEAAGELDNTYNEMGHHVQMQMYELGRDLGSWTGVQHELQADCLVGMWSGRADPRFEAGGPEAIVAALVDLSSPSHGTAEQRISAFGEGYYNGDLSRCLALTA